MKWTSVKLRVCLDIAENWKHCSKIIFKRVNSIVRPIFNEKVAKKWCLWVPWTMHSCTVHVESQHSRLIIIIIIKNKNKRGCKHNHKTQIIQIQMPPYYAICILSKFFFFFRESFNLWRLLLMIAFYHQTKTTNQFLV